MGNELVIVRGGGDIATGTIYKLRKCGYKVLVLEIDKPSAIRRNVAFSEAVYEGSWKVEEITARLAKSIEEAEEIMEAGDVAVMIDPFCDSLRHLKPAALVDGILAKKNLGTNRTMAPVTIALGPGFVAGEDVDAVIETMRGHHLGRIILEGTAIPNTGIPGAVAGFTKERVIHAPAAGILRNVSHVTDTVKKGQTIAYIEVEEGRVEWIMVGLLFHCCLACLPICSVVGVGSWHWNLWMNIPRQRIVCMPFSFLMHPIWSFLVWEK